MKTLALLRIGATAGILVASALGASRPAPASADGASQAALGAPHAEHSVLVGFTPGTPAAERANARRVAGAVNSEPLSPLAADAEKLQLGPGVSVEQAITNLLRNPNVQYAEPDYVLQRQVVSNDTYYTSGQLWGMYGDATWPANQYGSGAGEAWAAGKTGSSSVYVGVIDEGIQYTHPDLDANVWLNPFDTADGIDNDGNGKVDDVRGWDFYYNNNSVYDGTADDHGTHVAGTIGAEGGNGTGVAGVNWQVTLISTKFLGPSGGYTSDAIKALDYLTDLKKRHDLNIVATNNSWGGGGFSQSLLDAINRSGDAGILFIAAAGNSGANNDTSAFYPANYQCVTRYDSKQPRGWDCLIAVAAINSSGAKASFSSYGATSVDIGAPGQSILSTVPTNSYAYYSGTSMATPHVTGAVALCASVSPSFTPQQLRAAVLTSAAPTASLAGITVTGGRLDIGTMANQCASSGPANQAPVANSQSVTTNEDTPKAITLTGSDPDGDALTFAVVSGPAHGTLTGSVPALTYTPVPNFNGSDSFTFTTTDGSLTSAPATVSITVTPVNDPPVANSQSVSVVKNVAKAITLTGSDVDGDILTYAVATNPTNGTLTGTAPNLTYMPNTDYTGPDSFTFTVSDGLAISAPATVSITVSAPVPGTFSISASPGTRNVNRGGQTTYTVTLTASGGYSSTVALTATGLPTDASASFSPASLTPTASNTLTVTTLKTTPKGTYTLTITGTGTDGTTRSTTVSLRVR